MIVTAWNPNGKCASDTRNNEAQARLRLRLSAEFKGFEVVMNGEGAWQEPAFLVRGATLRDAITWQQEFQQAAVVFGVGGRAALVWSDGHVERFWALIQRPISS